MRSWEISSEWDIGMIKQYVALDLETSGLNPSQDRIIEIGMAKVEDGRITDQYAVLVDPQIVLEAKITELTGITQEMLAGQPVIEEIIEEVLAFIGEYPILGHNITFDYSFLKKAAVNRRLCFEKQGIDTLRLARRLLPDAAHKNLSYLCRYFQIDTGNSHRAYDDAVSAIRLYERLHALNPADPGFDELIALNYSVKRDAPVTPAQKRYLTSLVTMHGLTLQEPVEQLSKSSASRLIDRILSQYGR